MRSLDASTQFVTLEISSNGASGPWTTLDTFAGPASESIYTTISYNIAAYISSQTTIRLTSSGMSGGNRILFDNIELPMMEPVATAFKRRRPTKIQGAYWQQRVAR